MSSGWVPLLACDSSRMPKAMTNRDVNVKSVLDSVAVNTTETICVLLTYKHSAITAADDGSRLRIERT
jgi:hypothetical protein